MKKFSALVTMTMILGTAVAAHAGGEATLNVTAHVVGTCQFLTDTDDLAFGDLDPSIGGDVTKTSTGITFWCTKNATYELEDDDGEQESGPGARRMVNKDDGTEFVAYDITYTPTGLGKGRTTPITLEIEGTVLQTAYENAAEGDYEDTVTITIEP